MHLCGPDPNYRHIMSVRSGERGLATHDEVVGRVAVLRDTAGQPTLGEEGIGIAVHLGIVHAVPERGNDNGSLGYGI